MFNGRVLSRDEIFKLIIVVGAIFIFHTGFMVYSVSKYKALSNRSLVKSDVVMRVIQHKVKSVCPRCGLKGVPMCPSCSVDMYWNGYKGSFVCSSCGAGGFPQCSRCGTYMNWIEAI